VVNRDNNKQNDTDALHTEDILPPYNKNIHQRQDLQEKKADKIKGASSQNELRQSVEDITSHFIGEKSKHANDPSTESPGPVQETSEIPKFDLAEQILAEQRKITAIRRKAPGKKTKATEQQPHIESIGYTIKQPSAKLSEQEQIIAEIVARDIEKLYRGDTSSIQGQYSKDGMQIVSHSDNPPRS